MLKRMLALVVVMSVVSLGVAYAADALKLSLKDCKWKGGGDELGGYDENDSRFFMYTNGTCTGEIDIPAEGEFTITIEASCTPADKELAKFKLMVGETEVTKEQALKAEDAKEYALTAKLKKGKQKVVVEFLNDKYKEGEYDMNLFIHGVKFEEKK